MKFLAKPTPGLRTRSYLADRLQIVLIREVDKYKLPPDSGEQPRSYPIFYKLYTDMMSKLNDKMYLFADDTLSLLLKGKNW